MSSLFPVYPQIACAWVTAVAGGVTAENLQVASATNPTGIDRQTPSLSWELRATLPEAHDLGQSSYRILVASSAEELAEDRGSLWDSGRVQSSQRLYVTHCGRPLTSHQSYYWKVRVWDQVGKASGWSAPAKWTTAILHPDEWKARWIAAEPDGPLPTQPSENRGNWTESVQPLPILPQRVPRDRTREERNRFGLRPWTVRTSLKRG
jgi:hypothetical protein